MSQSTTDGGSKKASNSPERGFFARLMLFFRQVIDELRKVVTPTREELVKMTGVVLVFVVIVILLVTLLDWLFGMGASFVFGTPESV